jgi:hypothetical protein
MASNLDESTRPPTFVQIRPPARSGPAYRMLAIAGVGIALVTALGWSAYRLTVHQTAAPVAMPATSSVTETLPPQPAPADLESELVQLTIDTAVSAPAWRRESLMDRLSPFDASVPEQPTSSDAPPADTADAMQAGSYEVSVRLDKGETIGSALQKLGFEAASIADAVSALKPHVRLKRLPVGLGMTLQIRPPETEGAKPILQALTVHPDGRREITVERDDQGQYVVESAGRSTAR